MMTLCTQRGRKNCSAACANLQSLSVDDVPVFDREYLHSVSHEVRAAMLNRGPAALNNFIDDWPALSSASDAAGFLRRFGYHRIPHAIPELRGQNIAHPMQDVLQDVGFLIIPNNDVTEEDWRLIRLVHAAHPPPEILRSLYWQPNLSVGAVCRIGVTHTQHAASWLALLTGAKLWYLAPPHLPQPEDPHCDDLDLSASNARRDGVLRHLQLPGEVLYFPDM